MLNAGKVVSRGLRIHRRLLAGGSKRAFCEVKAEDKEESDLNPEANDTSVETPNQKDPKSAGVILTLENGKLPMYAFPPEDPTEKEERLNKLNEETEMLKLENEEIIEEDKRIIASNKQVLEESKKFENRDKALEFEDRPFKSREDDPNPLSPNTIELTESVVERIVEHARFLPDDYLDARLFPTMADKRTHMQDPNYNEFVLSKIKEKAKPRVRGAELSEDEEIKLHFDVKELPELDASETRDMRERFNLDIYDNIERVLIKEKFNPSARKTQAMMRIEANELKEKEQKRTESENQSIFDYIEEETIIDWPRRVREIARKTNIRYYESHMPNGELDWRFNESLAPITEDNQDKFSKTASYTEFDEFRMKHGMDVYEEDLENPFALDEYTLDCEDEDMEEFDYYENQTPLPVRAENFRLSGMTQEVLWALHTKNKKRFTIRRLAKLFELTKEHVQDVVELKQEEKDKIKNGELVSNLEWQFVYDNPVIIEKQQTSSGKTISITNSNPSKWDLGLFDKDDEMFEGPFAKWIHTQYPFWRDTASQLEVDEINIDKYKAYDAIRIKYNKDLVRPNKAMVDHATSLVPGAIIDMPRSTKSRSSYVFTDLTERKHKLFKIFVREKMGRMRNGSVLERHRALIEELPTKKLRIGVL